MMSLTKANRSDDENVFQKVREGFHSLFTLNKAFFSSGLQNKITDISKHMALLTVIFTSVNKNKILTCTGMQNEIKHCRFHVFYV